MAEELNRSVVRGPSDAPSDPAIASKSDAKLEYGIPAPTDPSPLGNFFVDVLFNSVIALSGLTFIFGAIGFITALIVFDASKSLPGIFIGAVLMSVGVVIYRYGMKLHDWIARQ